LFGHVGSVDAELGGIGGKRFVPIFYKADSADRKHHANAFALKIVDYGGVHSNRDSVSSVGVGDGIHQVNKIDKNQNEQVDRGLAGAAINEPVIVGVECGHVGDGEPATAVGVTVPDAVDLHLGLGAES
jgi:hypothetical protein